MVLALRPRDGEADMRVTALSISYPPHRRIGAEIALHELCKHLVGRGHEVSVVTTERTPPTTIDGVQVAGPPPPADVVISQGGLGVLARRKFPNATHWVWAHNNQIPTLLDLRSTAQDGSRVLANTHHMAGVLKSVLNIDAHVLHPPVWPAPRTGGDAVTLVNLTPDKGSNTFYELAKANPDVQFLGVKGGYGKQDIRHLPNVTIFDHGPMDRVWDETRILLLPSRHESYSMTAVEAAVRGIPAVASDLPGVREALGAGALYPTVWQSGLEGAFEWWDQLSDNALLHQAMNQPLVELDMVVDLIEESV